MGGVPSSARPVVIQWIEDPRQIDRRADAWVWIATPGCEDRQTLARATDTDLADAAPDRRPDGGAGRLLRGRLLRTLAAAVLDQDPPDVAISRSAAGALTISSTPELYVSAAVAPPWSIVGLAMRRLGVDLETHARAAKDLQKLWPRLSRDARLERWTQIEAISKATGLSLDDLLEGGGSQAQAHLQLSPRWGHGYCACAALSSSAGEAGP